jgi:hypothetical protein
LSECAEAEPVEASPSEQVAVLIYAAQFRRLSGKGVVYVVLPISHIVGISVSIMTLMRGGVVRLASIYDPGCFSEGDRGRGCDHP